MIDAKEIRIGNAVFKKDAIIAASGGVTYANRLHIINHYDIYHMVEDGDPTNHPIPLNPEWLERCGFKRMNAGWINGSGSMSFYDKDSQAGNGFYEMEYGTRGCSAVFIYLHQLQNLYYSLTGEELTVNNEHLQSTSRRPR
jgi:hypothetical protein